jgi:hypothetical protein
VGLAIFANAGRPTSKRQARAVPVIGQQRDPDSGAFRGSFDSGPVTLTPATSPLGGFIVLLIFALIWNGIIFGILLFANVPGPAKIFLSIFALIGLGLIAGVIHQFLALFNPRPTVQASSQNVPLGAPLDVRFSFTGNVRRITKLRITLKGEEVATYRRGTDTVTDRHVFYYAVLLETTDHGLMQAGSASITIPNESMHSFNASNNKIEWKLGFHGEIPKWPDVKFDFPIVVLPHPLASAAAVS